MPAIDQRALDDIAKYGCHILHVLGEGEGDHELPPFSYSTGICQTHGAPEVIVVGLRQELAHWMVNEYCRRVSEGESFAAGERYQGFLDGFEVTFRDVHRSHYSEHLGLCVSLYEGEDFPCVQLVFPSTAGAWPWDESAPDSFRRRQPVLDEQAPGPL